MAAPPPTPDALLRLCGAAAPAGWFPSEYARGVGADRDSLDEPLNRLRLAGLVEIGGWEAGRGQCYVLTDAGRAALADPRVLARLGDGARVAPAAPAPPRPGRLTAWDRGEAVRTALFAPGGTPVTWTLLAAVVGVFVLGLVMAVRRGIPPSEYLKAGASPVQIWLAVSAPAVQLGHWWTLVGYSLAHGGLLHLLMNSAALFALGPLMERALGSARFLVLWLFGALGGGVAVVLDGSAAIGASGALCALLTAAMAFIWLNRRHLGPDVSSDALRRLSTAVILTVIISLSPGVSWQGHLGGGVAGLVAGVLLTYHRFGTPEQRWAALLGLVLLPLAGVAPLVERHILRLPGRAGEPGDGWGAGERIDFDLRVAGPVERVRRQAEEVSDRLVAPLRDTPADARNPNQVQAARQELKRLHNAQDATRGQVERAGPYTSPVLEEARAAALSAVTSAAAVTTGLDACLAYGPRWRVTSEKGETDEMRLQQLFNEALEADLRWRHALRKAVAAQ